MDGGRVATSNRLGILSARTPRTGSSGSNAGTGTPMRGTKRLLL